MSEAKYFVFDVESTGIDVFEDRIVQFFGATADKDGNLLEKHEIFIDPGIPVPEEAANVHGFTNEFLAEHGVSPKEGLEQIRELLLKHRNLTLVAFNMSYDLSIIDTEMKRHGVADSLGTWFAENGKLVDGLVIDRHKDKYRKGKRTLENQAKHYGVKFDPEAAHNAVADTEATARVTVKILEKFGTPTTKEQAQWQEAWRSGFESFLRKSDPTATVERGWPLKEGGGSV